MPKEGLKAGLDRYQPLFEQEYVALVRGKLGLTEARPDDRELIDEFLGLLQRVQADYTIVFRELGSFHRRRRRQTGNCANNFLIGTASMNGWHVTGPGYGTNAVATMNGKIE